MMLTAPPNTADTAPWPPETQAARIAIAAVATA